MWSLPVSLGNMVKTQGRNDRDESCPQIMDLVNLDISQGGIGTGVSI